MKRSFGFFHASIFQILIVVEYPFHDEDRILSLQINVDLRQCVMRGGLPFDVVVPQYKPEVIEAMEEK